MFSCCVEFEKHCQKTDQDGFWISRGVWLLPYEVRIIRLCYQVAGEQISLVPISFCPWCGCDLKSGAKPLKESK
jgi:hypothetical protein